MNTLPKGLYYCQYYTGIGHLIRSLHICRCLVKTYEIDFLLGGADLGLTLDSPRFHLIPLPAISSLTPQEKLQAQQTTFIQRKNRIDQLQGPYDFLIIEMFPFGKWELNEEIEALIIKVKKDNPHIFIACSLRDSFPSKNADNALQFVEKYYDLIFVHADPRLFQLKESFRFAGQIENKLVYTGFITHPEVTKTIKPRQKRIVVSIGAGSFGIELMEAVIRVANRLPDYVFVFIQGPKIPLSTMTHLEHLATKEQAENVHFQPFMDNFPDFLRESALSISLGGYTIMDAVLTKTPALVLPTQFFDQYVRSIKFKAFGFVQILTKEELAPELLYKAIESALKMPSPSFEIDMSGAQTTYQLITKLKNRELPRK